MMSIWELQNIKLDLVTLCKCSYSLGNWYPLENTSGHYSPIYIMNKSEPILLHVAKINYRKSECKANRYTKAALGLLPYPTFGTITMKTGL